MGNINFRLGWACIRSKKDIDRGIACLRKAGELIPNNPDIMSKLAGALYKEKNELDESLTLLEKVVNLQPKNAEAFLLMGKVSDKKNDHLRAIECFNSSIRLFAELNPSSPPFPNLFFLLGDSLEKIKDFKKCILNYKKCLTLDNKHFGSCIHLANLLANLGEGQRAAKYFKHALRIDPENVNARFGLAKTLQ